ncbi:MAG TPA: response regulator [Chitinophaga sp.]|uniref:LytR/AlgR family response regulator transcription factor n=1 Tax=Chitinophaga sp. TaxID=1869181 RepID=UPI002BEB4519|nr:response regulator [Chitinophaga sp.]HVI44552.1 response regulator [Chitinophaga sp.]
MIKAIIIDDERNSRDIIALMLEKYCPHIIIADMASDCTEGIAKILEHRPGLVFLDLEMPDGTGFDVLMGTQPEVPFEAVFVTAFEKKFMHIIRCSEVELILKPIDKESLVQAVNLVTSRISNNSSKQRYQVLLENFNNNGQASLQLLLQDDTGEVHTVLLKTVEYLEANLDNCLFHLSSGAYIRAERPFRYYADLFTSLHFYQINNMQMVQLSNVSHADAGNGKVVLKSGVVLDITERRKRDLMTRLHGA